MVTREEIARAMAVNSEESTEKNETPAVDPDGSVADLSSAESGHSGDDPTADISGNGQLPTRRRTVDEDGEEVGSPSQPEATQP